MGSRRGPGAQEPQEAPASDDQSNQSEDTGEAEDTEDTAERRGLFGGLSGRA